MLQVVPQGPAAKAGIRAGDVVTYIDGAPITDLSGPQRVDKILGSVAGAHHAWLVGFDCGAAGIHEMLSSALNRAAAAFIGRERPNML